MFGLSTLGAIWRAFGRLSNAINNLAADFEDARAGVRVQLGLEPATEPEQPRVEVEVLAGPAIVEENGQEGHGQAEAETVAQTDEPKRGRKQRVS